MRFQLRGAPAGPEITSYRAATMVSTEAPSASLTVAGWAGASCAWGCAGAAALPVAIAMARPSFIHRFIFSPSLDTLSNE